MKQYHSVIVFLIQLKSTVNIPFKSTKLNDAIDYAWSELVYALQSIWSMTGDKDPSKYDDKSQLKTESYQDFLKGHAEYLKEKARNDKFFISPDRAIVGAGKIFSQV